MNDKNNMNALDCDAFASSEWGEAGKSEWARRKVFAGFSRWVAGIRNRRLVERSGRLWKMLQAGGLTRSAAAAIVGALLYCISPLDLTPDVIPIIGLLDDLWVVACVLSYLGNGKS